MTLVRYNPNRSYLSMQDTMNSLVNALFNTELSNVESENGEYAPRMDMKELEDAYTVKLTMPGIDKDNIDISLTDGVLTVKGETKDDEEKEGENGKWLVREHKHFTYYRSVRLPSEVQADKAEAEYKNGVLLLTLPKAEEVKPKSIPVKISD
ncbi:MAG: Hsp20/alpha crystallin family protein [Anaerolineaceae bacterium]|nr:Hsp20/alpha crystallin family protein [Anaerolineaceae bacterium]